MDNIYITSIHDISWFHIDKEKAFTFLATEIINYINAALTRTKQKSASLNKFIKQIFAYYIFGYHEALVRTFQEHIRDSYNFNIKYNTDFFTHCYIKVNLYTIPAAKFSKTVRIKNIQESIRYSNLSVFADS